ncbi:CTQ-dependent lysine 6-oxidase LodA [Pedobacter cryoconitis]|uniref:L-lysine 6-oxidase n=1 Tax=Pedobacter cryoconitis TaxID=188932 RepID=A0A327S8H4_9SPHI|nr:CTQ-dependent lysine 6-oxidase LodA [Pedobacter cryoconitis]RAJ24642.1 L-lysine 6-oxidase [Pedobacter cryoconitis]
MTLKIHPSVGVARLGNSPDQICLTPVTIGGLPFEADYYGNVTTGHVIKFKDEIGLVKRQGQPFKIYSDDGTELTLDSPDVESITWTVHLASKKAAWYQFSELKGNLLYGNSNSYHNTGVKFRNDAVTGSNRKTLLVDPGPRTISGREQAITFTKNDAPAGYPVEYPPAEVTYGTPIRTLGDLRTDNQGRLVVLGGYGNAGGDKPLTNYGGSDTWHDDISDGPVYATVVFNNGEPEQKLTAWIIVGSPDFAPEIVNISNLSDTMFDVGVRHFNLVPQLYNNGQYSTTYVADYKRDILPVIQRINRYQWVSNVQAMSAFCSNIFDFSDPSPDNLDNRMNYFSYFRRPDDIPPVLPPDEQPQQKLFREQGEDYFPMMPSGSGSNSVSEVNIVKFLALDETQYFLLSQWAKGWFVNDAVPAPYPVNPHDTASVGNCVGLPMCPGIEVTWSLQNSKLYESPYVIKHHKDEAYYQENGLTPSRDECEGGGCEPGDLTKRMACPWQADFFQCTVQYVNFTDPTINKENGKPKPPTYYSYWWPPQSPWDVIVGELTVEGQLASHNPAGVQVNYARGVNTFVQMVEHWSSLGFIRDQNAGQPGFPYIVETERVNELFSYKDVGVGEISGNPEDDETTIPVYFIEPDKRLIRNRGGRGEMLANFLETQAFKPIAVSAAGLGLPRSGSRNRR